MRPTKTGWAYLAEFGIDPSGGWGGDNSISWRLRSHPSDGAKLTAWSATLTPNSIDTDPYGVPVDQWTHLAFVFTGSKVMIYINGVRRTNQTVSGSFRCNKKYPLKIGMNTINSGNNYFKGYMDELRISKGVARWTGGSFIVPDKPYN